MRYNTKITFVLFHVYIDSSAFAILYPRCARNPCATLDRSQCYSLPDSEALLIDTMLVTNEPVVCTLEDNNFILLATSVLINLWQRHPCILHSLSIKPADDFVADSRSNVFVPGRHSRPFFIRWDDHVPQL
jgi:hypothetical protein